MKIALRTLAFAGMLCSWPTLSLAVEGGIVLPFDYTLVLSRGALIPESAPNSKAAQHFLDYLLSRRGQQVALKESFFFAEDAPLPAGVVGPEALMDSGIGRPIRIGPALLAAQDEIQRRNFIDDWKDLLHGF